MRSFIERFRWTLNEKTGKMEGFQYTARKELGYFLIRSNYPTEDGRIEIFINNREFNMPPYCFDCEIKEAGELVKKYFDGLEELREKIKNEVLRGDILPRRHAAAQRVIDETFGTTRFYAQRTGETVRVDVDKLNERFDRMEDIVRKNFAPEDFKPEFREGT